MSDVALYRKYRPKIFEEVLGQEQVVAALTHAIKNDNVGHAYIFSGGRGIGKTTIARIFARELGTHEQDLIEIDAASNRGIDDIRALREGVHTLPFSSPYKVYVIDEVHMLTKEAWNALLKTLEEPPKHVIFMMATTEPEKIPDTILSRCQTFTLKRPTISAIRDMILSVAGAEGYTIEPASADLIALLADGAFRDAHGILQKIIASSTGTTLTHEEVEAITGSPQSTRLVDLLGALARQDADEALAQVRVLTEQSNAKTVLTLLLRLVRAVLVVRSAPTFADTIRNEYTEHEWEAIRQHAETARKTVNSALLARLLDAQIQTGSTYTPELPLELAIIDLGADKQSS